MVAVGTEAEGRIQDGSWASGLSGTGWLPRGRVGKGD